MSKFVLVYSGGSTPESEEAQAAVMQAWTSWFSALGEAVVDPGNPFGASSSVSANGEVSGTGASGLTGYSVISAESLSQATEAASSCPVLADGGAVEVYETFDVM